MQIPHNPKLESLRSSVQGLRQRVLDHPLYGQLRTLEDLQFFMSYHVFAVWDFMSLLKRLQRDLTGIDLPWRAKGSPLTRRFINEIVLGEESDEDGSGGYLSHFEIYLKAMEECGADVSRMKLFLERLAIPLAVPDALKTSEVPPPIQRFVEHTWKMIEEAPVHAVAAAFTLGREDLVPDLFRSLVTRLHALFPDKLKIFHFYLKRHIELDENHHTPMAMTMLQELCGNSAERWQETQKAAASALEARYELWTGIQSALKRS